MSARTKKTSSFYLDQVTKTVKGQNIQELLNNESELWEKYIHSIAMAEYISDDNYSTKLNEIIKNLEKKVVEVENKKGKEERISIVFPYWIKAFVKVSWLVIEFCEKNKETIEATEVQEQIIVNTHRGIRFSRTFLNKFEEGEQKTRRFEWLLESIVEMTGIDHQFISTPENIEKLSRLYGRCEFFLDKKNRETFSINKNLLAAIKIKTAKLLQEIIDVEEKNGILILNDDKKILKKIEASASELTVFDFVEDRKNIHPNKIDEIKERIVHNPKTDEDRYNNYTIKGIEQYYNYRQYYDDKDKIRLTFEQIKEIPELQDEKPTILYQKLITDLFTRVYEEAKTITINENENLDEVNKIKEKLGILSRLTQGLHKFIEIHKTSKLSSFRPLFEDSFYELEENKPSKIGNKNNQTIFFASAGLPPIRIKQLEKDVRGFVYKIDELYFDWMPLINKKYAEDITTRRETVDKKIEFLEGKIKKTNDEAEKANKEAKEANDEAEKANKEAKETKRQNVFTLGVFAGLIAFVSASTSFFIFGENDNIDIPILVKYYAIFAFILISGLGYFAYFLKLLFEENENGKKWKRYWLLALIPVLFAFLIGLMFHITHNT